MVALDPNGRPAPLPRLELTTDEERVRAEAATARRNDRIARRS
jgi:acyl-CoA hydrolase